MFKTAYNLGDKEPLATVNNEESLTQQSDRDDCDINIIVKKYGITGQIPVVTGLQPLFGDFTEVPDYRTALERINAAKEAFHQIPANIRREFDNDPAKFIDFASNPDNLPKLREWKLANPEPTPAPAPAPAPKTGTNSEGDQNNG